MGNKKHDNDVQLTKCSPLRFAPEDDEAVAEEAWLVTYKGRDAGLLARTADGWDGRDPAGNPVAASKSQKSVLDDLTAPLRAEFDDEGE